MFIKAIYKNLQFFAQSVTHPGANANPVELPVARVTSVPLAGDKITYSELSLEVLLDEDMQSYIEMHNWMRRILDQDNVTALDRFKNATQKIPAQSDITLSILNSSNNTVAQIIYRDSAGSQIGNVQYIANTGTNGGLPSDDGTLADKTRLLYFGCGAGNLETSTVPAYSSAGTSAGSARPSNFAGWSYYTIRGVDDSFTAMTGLYYFIKQDGSCKGFKVRRLAFRNSLGAYDYFSFKKKSTQTIDVNRNTYSTMLGTFNKSKYRYNNTQRGKKTREVTATLKETLKTDWIKEQDANLVEKLIMSTDVYIVENADTTYTQGVVVTDSSFVRKTNANDKLIQYTIQIEYANPINTNS